MTKWGITDCISNLSSAKASNTTADTGVWNTVSDCAVNTVSLNPCDISISADAYSYSRIDVHKDGVSVVAKQYIPSPKLIQKRGRATIVTWDDGSVTRVVCEEDCEDSIFHAYCAAFTKKMMGSTTKVLNAIDNADERVIQCRERAAQEEARAKELEAKRIAEKKAFEREVNDRMHQMVVENEAKRRLGRIDDAKAKKKRKKQ